MTPLLTRIEQQLAQCADPDRRAELQAERASYLARTGNFAEANEILATLRRSYGDGRNARVSVWIMFVEGLVLYFERVSADARDRIFRAYAISIAGNIRDLGLLTAAWIAHLDFERGRYEEMGQLLSGIVEHAGDVSHDIRCRVAMILGDAFLYIGDKVKSQVWFELCRQNAINAGDRATMGALMYNRSAFGLARIRVEHFAQGGVLNSEYLGLVEMELESAWAFQVGTKVLSLVHTVELSRARILMLRGLFVQAIDLLAPLKEKLSILEDRPNRSSVLADLCLCMIRVGRQDEAADMLSTIEPADIARLDVDDQLVALSMAIKISDSLGYVLRRNEFESEVFRVRRDYEEEQARLKLVLGRDLFVSSPSSW